MSRARLDVLVSEDPCRTPQTLAPTGLFLEVVFGYLTAFAPSYEVFAASRLLVGLMNGGISVVCFVLAQEYVAKSYWAVTGRRAAVQDGLESVAVSNGGLCRDADQPVLRRGHRSVCCSGILDPPLEEPGHRRQLLRRPVLPLVCVRTGHMTFPLSMILVPQTSVWVSLVPLGPFLSLRGGCTVRARRSEPSR